MTASSSSNVSPEFLRLRDSGELFQMFRDQVRVSQELFESLREQMILQVSNAIKPLVTFLHNHDCDEDEILAALFEAIAYETNAELELGVLAFDKQRDWAEQTDTAVADRFSQLLYRIGLEMFRDFQNHRLYQHGFLPYQYRRMHGQDVLVDRLGVPEILHREQKSWDADRVWKPRGQLLNMDVYQLLYSNPLPERPVFQEHQPIIHRTAGIYEINKQPSQNVNLGIPAHDYLCGFATAFKNLYGRQADADAKKPTGSTSDSEVNIRHRDGRVERNVDESASAAWEKEIKAMFSGMFKRGEISPKQPEEPKPPAEEKKEEQEPVRVYQSQPNGDWTMEERKDFQAIQDYYNLRRAKDETNETPAQPRDPAGS